MDAVKYLNKLNLDNVELTKYLFFTGKGGVGKTTISSSIALNLAENEKKVALVSTDPASNLQDVFQMELSNKLTTYQPIPNLSIANFDPIAAADDYKAQAIEPYEGILPEDVLSEMKEQLSGSCTVEVAAFNEFTNFLSNETLEQEFDFIIFDTAPTGHTLRMLELPSAWTDYLNTTSNDASCLGQLSGLNENRGKYNSALEKLRNQEDTTMMLVAKPNQSSIYEIQRAQQELQQLSISKFKIVINNYIEESHGLISSQMKSEQDKNINHFTEWLNNNHAYYVPYKKQKAEGIESLSNLLNDDNLIENDEFIVENHPQFNKLIDEIENSKVQYLFTMGKGGVGKTTVATQLATALSNKGHRILLATTDPTKEINVETTSNLNTAFIDEEQALEKYKKEVLETINDDTPQDDIDYIMEDLKSPCTEEIAFFKAFSDIMENQEDMDYVIVDTAPTGHTLLLLDSSENHHKELKKKSTQTTSNVETLLPKIQNQDLTQMIIVTLAEKTPYLESERLVEDLNRADIGHNWWVVNQSLVTLNQRDDLFSNKKEDESIWINKIKNESLNNYFVIPYGGLE
ncbi:TPA: arsenical pump-driving ATPase [Staphylococcus aureus]|uniref:arsenical pump-driving ATPase n=1 Tax=Staphylococcus aureus TaxID=1280 RepID=UPI0013DE90C6|nr:arsenical pump-driving ATPase [Staphylococcus aureus]MBH4736476.1 arsenical pump-driving ATPase [Staphylococcus aureus]MBH4739482.1 arsenical pump-driving ATPase [Staphylococcus aureus]MBH4744768.1 arsenical pump-driving ATPase [Staphylococcus aureus]MBH4763239.1 arsenical pump-driving ATPase [Staphylococcus aureus]HDX8233924.1 arsenical pump-driving ATPase [Staphylococcus aureus]